MAGFFRREMLERSFTHASQVMGPGSSECGKTGLGQHRKSRPAIEGARTTFDQYLDGGGNRQLLAQTVLGAREVDLVEARSFYLTYLGRPAEPQGLDNATNILQAGLRDETLIAVFLATDEFFRHANNQ